MPFSAERCDIAIVGAGAAGLATAIFTRRLNPARSVLLLDGAKKPGAKILISGGSRCNVTNREVTAADFWGGPAPFVRRILRAFPVSKTVAFFAEIGIPLREEADGKLFPVSNRSRDVLDALLIEARRCGIRLATEQRVLDVIPAGPRFRLASTRGEIDAGLVVLATGGQSLPKTGSDGAGIAMARRLGHTVTPTTPGLVPLLLSGEPVFHRELAGVSQDVELTVWVDAAVATRIAGALLWTHFGISGPAALNASRHWLRAELEHRAVRLTASLAPGVTFDALDRRWTAVAAERPRASVQTALAAMIPAAVAAALLRQLGIDPGVSLAHFARDHRRRLVRAMTEWLLPVSGSRGYNYAEVTAGGIALTDVDPSTMSSRVCPGVFFVGEILDVDGPIGGFNFQWAWSSAHVAATALAS